MVDFSPIREEFEEAVGIRKELNSVHWKDYEALKIVFGALFADDPANLKLISDMNYYKGGYPGESSPAKIEALFWKVGTIMRYFSMIGRLDEINSLLGLYGFQVTSTDSDFRPMNREALNEDKKVTKAVDRVTNRFGFRVLETQPEMVQWFLNTTETLQRVICGMADEIKIGIFDTVDLKMEGQIDKSGFNTAVNAVANKQIKEEAKKDVNGLVEKALDKSEVLGNNGEFLRSKVTEKVV